MKWTITRIPRLAAAIVAVSLVTASLVVICQGAVLRADEPAAPAEPAAKEAPTSDKPAVVDWPAGLLRARQRAQTDGKPLLVRAGATWCPWCDKLREQIETPELQEELKRWTLVYVDIEETPGEARQLSIGPIPALRVVNASGKVVASQDGYMDQQELLAWLRTSFDRTALERPDVLTSEKELTAGDVDELIKLLQTSDPLAREAALRRLMPHQKLGAAPVVEAFVEGKLAMRLLTLELLAHWHAPVEGIDPWRPETVTPDRIKALQSWTEQETVEPSPPAAELSAEDWHTATDAIVRLMEVDDDEAAARTEQLARYGAALRPLVVEKLQAATTDRDRERLLLLRYRLAASDALVLSWAGGLARLARLASSDVNARHQATTQLVERATPADEPLLLELFADADPLVREISLRGLQTVGTTTSSNALIKLLDDPEPNVRAAVLKQLAESPDAAIVPRIAAYLKTETDPDLVVHGIRVLKAAKTSANLIELLHHSSWQVRAEAAEALGTLATPHQPSPATASIYAALIEVLSDEDPFVVSRAVHGLHSANLETAINPLVKAAAAHPELAAEVVEALTQGSFRDKSEAVLRPYLEHKDPKVRAQVINALARINATDVGDLIERGLKDPATEVRISTAHKLLELCNQVGPHGLRPVQAEIEEEEEVAEAPAEPPKSGGLLSSLGSIFFGSAPTPAAKTPKKKVVKEEKPDKAPVKEPDDDPRFVAFREGKSRPAWMNVAVAPLETMLQAEAANEKEVAALALLPFGHDEQALGVLRELIKSQHPLLDEAAQALSWLPWAERQTFFDELLAQNPDPSQLHTIAQQMIVRDPAQGLPRLWEMLEPNDQPTPSAVAVGRAIIEAYPDTANSGNGQMTLAQDKLAELTRYASEGTVWQKNVALARLISASAENASELAQRYYETPDLPPAFRQDAFQLVLIAADEKVAEKLAAGEIASPDPGIRKRAVLRIAGGNDAIDALRGELHLSHGQRIYRQPSQESINFDPPAGVTTEMLKPLLADPNEEVAAAAGYLSALLGNSEGLPTLVRVWRAHKGSETWTQLLYRSIAALDDDRNTPILLEINKQIPKWNKPLFYWTIRSMHGPAVLKLRKQIRNETGMENLR